MRHLILLRNHPFGAFDASKKWDTLTDTASNSFLDVWISQTFILIRFSIVHVDMCYCTYVDWRRAKTFLDFSEEKTYSKSPIESRAALRTCQIFKISHLIHVKILHLPNVKKYYLQIKNNKMKIIKFHICKICKVHICHENLMPASTGKLRQQKVKIEQT